MRWLRAKPSASEKQTHSSASGTRIEHASTLDGKPGSGTSDATPYYTTNIGPADTGGWIFLESAEMLTSNWNSPTTWRITCILL